MNGKSTSASRRKKKKKQRRKEGFACVCVRLQVGERERVEMDRRLSYIFFRFRLPPFSLSNFLFLSDGDLSAKQVERCSAICSSEQTSHVGRHCNAVAVPA